MKLKICLFTLPVILSSLVPAQTATYAFTGSSTGDNQFNNVTSAPTGGTFSSFTRTAVSYNAGGNVFNSSAWNTGSSIDTGEYVSYSVTPSENQISYLQQVSFGSQRSSTGPTSAQVSLFGNTSQTALASQSFSPPTSIATTTFNFSDVITGEAVTFRFYGWNASATGTLRFDEVATNGATANFQDNSVNLSLTSGTQVYADTSSLSLSGILSGAGGLSKIGSNSVALTGDNSYAGPTAVTGGTLILNGNQTNANGSVTVGTGAKLAGSGTVGGITTVDSGGKYSAGAVGSAGNQNFADNLTLSTNSIFEWDLTTASTLSGFDTVMGATGKAFVASGEFRVVTDLDFSSNTFWDEQQNWNTIFNSFGTATGWSTATAATVYSTSGSLRTEVADFGSFSVSGTTLTWTAVPEPSSAIAGLLLAAGLLRRSRRGV